MPPELDIEVVVPPPIEVTLAVPPPIEITLAVDQGPAGPRGPVGPAGPPGSSVEGGSIPKLSNGPISGGMVVRYTDDTHVAPADPAQLSHMATIAGVALTATSVADAELDVVRLGEMADSAWTWTPGLPIYLGTGGVLTQVYSPAWAFCLIVGAALTATRIVVDFRDPIIQG